MNEARYPHALAETAGAMRGPWPLVKLGEVCEMARGGSPRPIQSFLTDREDGINWIRISDAAPNSKYIYTTKEKIHAKGVRRSRYVKEGDFLLSNSMSFGRPYILKTDGCIHDGWLVLSKISGLCDREYLYYFLSSPTAYKQFNDRAAGSTVRNLNIDLVRSVQVPLPPLAIQREIIAIIEEAFQEIDAAIANSQASLALTGDLLSSYLSHSLDPSWQKVPVTKTFEILSPPTKVNTKYFLESGKIPIVDQSAKLVAGYWDNDDDKVEVSSPVVIFGDHTKAIKFIDFDFVAGADGIKILNPNPNILPKFLFYILQSTKLPNLGYSRHFKVLKGLSIPLPPLAIQREIVHKLERVSEASSGLEQLSQRKLAAYNALKSSLLAQAFCGKLTAAPPPRASGLRPQGSQTPRVSYE